MASFCSQAVITIVYINQVIIYLKEKVYKYTFFCFTDAPKFISNQTIYYSWEGNPINISCDVKSNPPASVHWRREKLVLPAKNTTNLKTYSAGRKMILEVSLHVHMNELYYFSSYLLFWNIYKYVNINAFIYVYIM